MQKEKINMPIEQKEKIIKMLQIQGLNQYEIN